MMGKMSKDVDDCIH